MKPYFKLSLIASLLTVAVTSCKKDPYPSHQNPERTIKFVLYTQKDFSDDSKNITFSIFIKTHSRTLFDSTFSVMKVKDIPKLENKLIVEKKVPGDDGSDLAAGFNYTIENVGNSWYIDTCKAGNTLKTIDYSFQ